MIIKSLCNNEVFSAAAMAIFSEEEHCKDQADALGIPSQNSDHKVKIAKWLLNFLLDQASQ